MGNNWSVTKLFSQSLVNIESIILMMMDASNERKHTERWIHVVSFKEDGSMMFPTIKKDASVWKWLQYYQHIDHNNKRVIAMRHHPPSMQAHSFCRHFILFAQWSVVISEQCNRNSVASLQRNAMISSRRNYRKPRISLQSHYIQSYSLLCQGTACMTVKSRAYRQSKIRNHDSWAISSSTIFCAKRWT